MRENQGQYPIRELAGIFGVSCSAYYKRAKQQGVSLRREEEDAEWVRLIREIEEEEQHYGPNVQKTCQTSGLDIRIRLVHQQSRCTRSLWPW
jgi:hypothetical protein